MKIQIKSDLHHEFWWYETRPRGANDSAKYIHPEADVIVLAGDIITKETRDSIVHDYGNCGKPVIFVPGNHEYYSCGSVKETRHIYAEMFKDTDIKMLDTEHIVIDGILFVGATLWTDLSDPMKANMAQHGLNDFRAIPDMTATSWTQKHEDDKAYLIKTLDYYQYKDLKKVVVTHYLPSYQSVHPKYAGSDLNWAFVGECESMFHEPYAPELWIHGHTHESCDYTIGKIRVICNPYGYSGLELNPNFKPDLLVEI